MRDFTLLQGDVRAQLDGCRREQREAREYLDGPGDDKRGAKQAVDDWTMEEALLKAEE